MRKTLIILSIFALMVGSCGRATNKQSDAQSLLIDSVYASVISEDVIYNEYTDDKFSKFDYVFRISTNQTINNLSEKLTVEIINNESSVIKLKNLVFTFYVDNGGYFAISEEIRFLDKALILKSKEHFCKTISINSFTFTNFHSNQPISITEMETIFKNSKTVRIRATIDDFRRLENPLMSSSLTYSNIIELQLKKE